MRLFLRVCPIGVVLPVGVLLLAQHLGAARKPFHRIKAGIWPDIVEDKRKWSRQCSRWLDGILQATGKCLSELKDPVLSRWH